MTVVAALGAATTAYGQWTFLLDQGFRTQIQYQEVNSLILLPDGNLIASGVMRFPGEMSDKRLVRLLTNGARDPAFYNSGLGGGRLTLWNNHYYVGTSQVRRILPNGHLDPSFISMGQGFYFSIHQGGDYHVYPDGRILMSGKHLLSDSIRGFEGYYNLIWFSNEGYLDTTLVHRQGNGVVNRFAELPNGQFICSGTCTEFEGKAVDWIFRVHADGTPDTTFRTGVYIGEARTYLPLPDGRVYVGGNFRRTEAPQDTLRLVRFMPDGSLDPSFTIPQFLTGDGISDPFGAYVFGLYQFRPDRIIVVGQFRSVNGEPRKSICMIDTTGQVLPAFDDCGVGTFTQFLTGSSILEVLPTPNADTLYICGVYTGYNDGQVNDPLQRFVSRLLVQEITTEVAERDEPPLALQLYPNPARGLVVVSYALEQAVGSTELVMRDPAGREVARLPLGATEGRAEWGIQGLPAGVYTVELRQAGHVQQVSRLVVQP